MYLDEFEKFKKIVQIENGKTFMNPVGLYAFESLQPDKIFQ